MRKNVALNPAKGVDLKGSQAKEEGKEGGGGGGEGGSVSVHPLVRSSDVDVGPGPGF